MLPIVAFPRGVLRLVVALVRQLNEQPPVSQAEVQMKVLSSRPNAHPPVVVIHLFQMDGCARGDNLIESGPTVLQRALSSDFESALVLLPGEVLLFHIAHAWIIALGSPMPSARVKCVGSPILQGASKAAKSGAPFLGNPLNPPLDHLQVYKIC